MILSDFLTLELYFSSPESVQFLEDCADKYGVKPVRRCIAAGDLVCKHVHIGPDQGKSLLYLSDKGRMKANAPQG